jgi:hypothetical protein
MHAGRRGEDEMEILREVERWRGEWQRDQEGVERQGDREKG